MKNPLDDFNAPDEMSAVLTADARRLASMFVLESDPGELWADHEFREVVEHQMDAALVDDLAALDPAARPALLRLASASEPYVRFRDIFTQPHPPLWLCKLMKRFGVAMQVAPESPLPGRVARMLYVGAVLVARRRLAVRIAEAGDDVLATSVQWLLECPWVVDPVRSLLQEALPDLQSRNTS